MVLQGRINLSNLSIFKLNKSGSNIIRNRIKGISKDKCMVYITDFKKKKKLLLTINYMYMEIL